MTKTILDEIETMTAKNLSLCDELKTLEDENRKLREALADREKENASQKEQIVQLNKQKKQLDFLKDKLDHFKRVFWKIYIFRE